MKNKNVRAGRRNRGMMYTITTFLIFLGILSYVSALAGFEKSFQDADSAGLFIPMFA